MSRSAAQDDAALARLELLAEIDTLMARLDTWAGSAPDWRPAEQCAALVRRLATRTAALRMRIEAPLVVATLGGSGTGKSALVNALTGAEVVRTGRTRPTTTRPTLVCRPGVTPEMLGIEADSVELVQRDLPSLENLILIDCPDPDTTEEASAPGESSAPGIHSSNLSRLRAILPKCDVLLVTATQQKYHSARVIAELTAAAPGAYPVFVQTHADTDADIRADWQAVLNEESAGRVFRIDSLQALADAQAGLQPRGEFAELTDLLARQLAGAARNRIRREAFLELTARTLDACNRRLEEALPSVREVQTAIERQRALLAGKMAAHMHTELLANRRQWENRLLAQAASRWGLSPFALVLRMYLGLGGLIAGALLYRVRTPAQAAIWGVVEGARAWRKRLAAQQTDRSIRKPEAAGLEPAELQKSAIILEGHAAEAELGAAYSMAGCPLELSDNTVDARRAASEEFVERVAADLDSLVNRLAKRHTGPLTRFGYEFMLLVMLGMILYRLGKNFFYDSWLAVPAVPLLGVEYYLAAAFWLTLWCLLLLWAFCGRLRRGLRKQLDRLAAGWAEASAVPELFANLERKCRRAELFCQELELLRNDVERLRRRAAVPLPSAG